MLVRDQLFIGGRWVTPRAPQWLHVHSPHDGHLVGRAVAGDASDVDAAVNSAIGALDAWSDLTPDARAKLLERMADYLESQAPVLTKLIVDEVGTPIRAAQRIQVALPIANLRNHATRLRKITFTRRVGHSLVSRQPAGIVAAITPWNYPLHQAVLKVAGALAAGCGVVLKPSELTPLNAFYLADAAHAAGLPAGVFNLVTGSPAIVGTALVSHAGVDRVSFTGSTETGRLVAATAAQSLKRVSLELGGKSAAILLDDAPLEKAVRSVVRSCNLNSGQTCTALTRLLVPKGLVTEAQRIAADCAQSLVVGDPHSEGSQVGPLISRRQLDRVRTWIVRGESEGAALLAGGKEPLHGLPAAGHYVRPTVFGQVDSRASIAREEIFGPVLCVMSYGEVDDAIDIANSTPYGLAGAVWSADSDRALAVAQRIRAGQVDINGAAFNPEAPFGGFKQSGYGREAGEFGIEDCLEYKSIQLAEPTAHSAA